MKKEIKANNDEKYFFDKYILYDLANTYIRPASKAIDYVKNTGSRNYNILLIVDDWADDPSFTRHSKVLHQFFIRGSHSYISTIVCTQVYNAISTIN